jgi:hypothetical protein
VKKFLAVLFILVVLGGGIVGCKKQGPDPHEGLYGTYKMVSFENGGVEILYKGNTCETNSPAGITFFSSEVNAELNSFINEVIAQAGDTIAIYKNGKIRFSGGSMEREVDYEFYYSWSIDFERTDFPFYFVRCDTFKWGYQWPPVYQLETRKSFDIDEETYMIHFYYKEYNKF